MATHMDGQPMALGDRGLLWAVFDADRFPDMLVKPLAGRFAGWPCATYRNEVKRA